MTQAGLHSSIKKWIDTLESMSRPSAFDIGFNMTPLCISYAGCTGCPIHQKTKIHGCNATPYMEVERTLHFKSEDEVFRKAVVKEINFLESLLEEESDGL